MLVLEVHVLAVEEPVELDAAIFVVKLGVLAAVLATTAFESDVLVSRLVSREEVRKPGSTSHGVEFLDHLLIECREALKRLSIFEICDKICLLDENLAQVLFDHTVPCR